MLISTHQMAQLDISAHDGLLGKMLDLYFDERSWETRYIVVESGSWLRKHRVLISPRSIVAVRPSEGTLDLDLTREQIRNCPAVDPDQPVSREQEIALHEYYGWSPYWKTTSALAATALPSKTSARSPAFFEPDRAQQLRSVQTIRGYNVDLKVGGIGQVEDFMVDHANWFLPYLIINTRNWFPRKKVVIPSSETEGISWYERRVFVDIDEDRIKNGPEWPDSEVISPEYESALRSHYRHSGRRTQGAERYLASR